MTFLPDESLDQGESSVERYARLVKTRKEGIRLGFLAITGVFTIVMGFLALLWIPDSLNRFQTTRMLQQRGVSVLADVDGFKRDSCGRNCRATYANFHFRDAEAKITRRGAVIAYLSEQDQPLYNYAFLNKKIPIIYDPLNTDVYRENFNDKIRKQDAIIVFMNDILLFSAIFVGPIIAFGIYTLFDYFKSAPSEDVIQESRFSRYGSRRSSASKW